MNGRHTSLVIETPEGVVFSYELATPVCRALAWAVDAAAITAAGIGVGKVCQTTGILSADVAKALGVVFYFGISVAYGIVLEWRWRGQTLGKRILGLRVIDAQGLRLQFPQIAIRNLLRLFDALPIFYLVGGIAALLSRYGQRFGDIAANTVVTHERRREQPDIEDLAPAKYNSLLAYPHVAARLRSAATPEAVGIALRAVAQRDSFQPLARVELFRDLAGYFRSLAAFPESAMEGLTDEQFVRSVLRVVFAPR